MKINYEVRDGGDWAGGFLRREDAEAFARPEETVNAVSYEMAFAAMMYPRRNVAGDLAEAEAEAIGVW